MDTQASKKNQSIHAFTNDVLGQHDATAIAQLIRQKKILPREVIEASIKRAEKVEPQLHAIVCECFDKALKNADQIGDGFFAGVPMFFKDMTLVKGLPMYFGSEAFEGMNPAKVDDPITKQVLAQGFATLGTSTMPEFGFTCSTEYPHREDTRNPWNTAHTVGGSSGGAGALVAAGVVPIAHSADGGGSTRIPAACNGAVGLKATRGRLLLSSSLQRQVVPIAIDGVITRSVRDTANFYSEAEKYYRNKKLKSIGSSIEPLRKKLRIGFADALPDVLEADALTKSELVKAVDLLTDLGHELKPVEFPVSTRMVADFKLLWSMNAYMVNRFGKMLFPKGYNKSKLTSLTQGLANYYGKQMHKTPFFVRRLWKSKQDYKAFLEENKIDVLLTPTLAHRTPELGYLGADVEFEEQFERMANWASFTPMSNAAGCPSISLPLGFDEEKNLPLGMLFWARHGEDKLLLELALQLEEAAPWRTIS